MGVQQSKDQLLFEQVNYGNIDGIRSLRNQGAGLEWVDKEGKTPLILACLRHDLLNVAKVLIELGANVNGYRPGSHAGTPLHHAAKKGLEQTVHLLLSHGANPFIMNDDCHTPIDLAREKGHVNVVRAMESRISLFSGWLRENYGPGFLEALAPQLMSRKIWAVVLPCDRQNPSRPLKFELAVYTELQVAKPIKVIHLWKCHIEEPKFNDADPSIIIIEKSTRSKHKFLSGQLGDKQQIQWFYNACRGVPQATTIVPTPPIGVIPLPNVGPTPVPPPNTIPAPIPLPHVGPTANQDDFDLALAINASIQSALVEGIPVQHQPQTASASSSSAPAGFNGWSPQPDPSIPPPSKASKPSTSNTYNGWGVTEPNPSSNLPVPTTQAQPVPPSAPPIVGDGSFYTGPIQYPSIDSSPVDTIISESSNKGENGSSSSGNNNNKDKEESSICVICLDSRVEGACIPCGHMVGCMSCLREIEAKSGDCPICRAKIEKVLKLYAV